MRRAPIPHRSFGRKAAVLGLTLALLGAACGGSDDPESGDTTTASDDGSGAIDDYKDVKLATVQIVSQGTFVEPDESLAVSVEISGAGSGSGFIIDPSGIVVTNNHVVAGAATLDVYVGGSDEPVSAKVLGVSECSDLAVIDIEGDEFPFLEWYEGDIEAGLDVYAAGFPLGDPEFTLVSGIVSKAEADGETNWASVPSVIQHDAAIQPGNSGGPLVTTDGKVVAVNYSGGDPGTGTSQYFAISAAEATGVVDQLRDKENVDSLGINGRAVFDEENGIGGIWVSSVESGSPAGDAGIEGGDIIERIEGLPMGADGVMTDYCKVLRSHEPDSVLSVQVLRFADSTRLRGEFNGDELELVESFGSEVENETGDLATGSEYTEYMTITDSTGQLQVDVPVEWSDVADDPYGTYADFGPSVGAAPDLDAFANSWETSGMQLAASFESAGNLDAVFDSIDWSGSCTPLDVQDYDDGLYTGYSQIWDQCGGLDTAMAVIVAEPPGQEFVAYVQVQLASEADLAALDKIIETFRINLG